jgi:metallophosphoesterase superfamily enzyme
LTHTVIVSDLHAPYHNAQSWAVCLKAIKVLKPERIVVIGDFADCYSVSSFDKDPSRSSDFEHEIDLAAKELRKLCELADGDVDYCEGNHEFRLVKYLQRKAKELHRSLNIRDRLLQGIRGVRWVPYRQHIRVGKVMYTHDVGHAGVYAGRHTLSACGHNVVFGHTHRGGIVVDGDHTGDRRFSLNVGWMGDSAQVDYMHQIKTKDWTQGFGYVYTDPRSGLVWPAFVPIMAGHCYVAGKWISV